MFVGNICNPHGNLYPRENARQLENIILFAKMHLNGGEMKHDG